MKKHWCQSCRGKGKILVPQTKVVHGVKKTYDVLVDCPSLLADRMKESPMSAQDRAAGERE